MAKPIEATPVLEGSDALAFIAEMEKNEKASEEERKRIKADADIIRSMLTFAFQFEPMQSNRRIVRLTEELPLKPFDCGNADLNDFLLNDAKAYASRLLAVTYLLEDDKELLAFSPY